MTREQCVAALGLERYRFFLSFRTRTSGGAGVSYIEIPVDQQENYVLSIIENANTSKGTFELKTPLHPAGRKIAIRCDGWAEIYNRLEGQ